LSTLNLPETIDRELQRHAIAPESLIVEITESGLMHDARIGLDVLLRLRLKGIGLSIDDFGTGYSTINQLRRLPFTELKIDQSFVASATKNPASRIILESSIEMARRLNLRTVAEGVETEQDLELIRSLGCDVVQGFLVAKPMPLEEFIVWMEQHGAGTGR
jgi:EAL domain-containing protein (putative c-di-GMP-specific phosphodiesterase class I)